MLDTSGNADRKQADRLREALTRTGVEQVDAYLNVFLTEADRTERATVVTNAFVNKNPAIGQSLDRKSVV